MKYIANLLIALLLFDSSIAYSAKRLRSAVSSSVGSGSKLTSAISSGKSSTKHSNSNSSKKSKNKHSKSDKSSEKSSSSHDNNEVKKSKEEQCLFENINSLLDGSCSYLKDEEITSSFENGFLCIYNHKDKTKSESVNNIFLYQNYGIKETGLKDKDSNITIKNNPKGSAKYYEYLIKELNNNTLVPGKIVDSIAENALSNQPDISISDQSNILSYSVETTLLPTNLFKSNLTKCQKEIKEKLKQCSTSISDSLSDKIIENCNEYEQLLIKRVSDYKAKLFDLNTKLTQVLKQRLATTISNQAQTTSTSEKTDTTTSDSSENSNETTKENPS